MQDQETKYNCWWQKELRIGIEGLDQWMWSPNCSRSQDENWQFARQPTQFWKLSLDCVNYFRTQKSLFDRKRFRHAVILNLKPKWLISRQKSLWRLLTLHGLFFGNIIPRNWLKIGAFNNSGVCRKTVKVNQVCCRVNQTGRKILLEPHAVNWFIE